MESTLISSIKFYSRSIQYRIGNTGLLGLFMLATSCVLYVTLSMPQSAMLRKMELIAANTKLQVAFPTVLDTQLTNQNKNASEAVGLLELAKQFPQISQKDAALQIVFAIASKNGLILESGEYETIAKQIKGLALLQISLPLKGTYPQIKRFIATVLNTLQNAALAEISFERSAVESNRVDAHVVFTLYFTQQD